MNVYYERYKRWEITTCSIIILGTLFLAGLGWLENLVLKQPLFFDYIINTFKSLILFVIPLFFVGCLTFALISRKYRILIVILLIFLIMIELIYYSIYVYYIDNKYIDKFIFYYTLVLISSIIIGNRYVLKYKNIIKNSNSPELKSIYEMKINLYPECLPRQYKIYGGLLLFYFVIFTYCSVWWAFYFLFTGKNIFYDFFVLFFIWSATDLTLSFIYKQKNIYGSKIEGSFWLWVLLETLIILPLHHFYISFFKLIGMC